MGLRSAAIGLMPDEIAAILGQHLQEYRRLYTCGSGCGHFWMTEIAIPKAGQVNAEKTADHKAKATMTGVADAYDLIAE
jgi:hypothetical protein